MSKRSKADLRIQEFNSQGVWDWRFPEGRFPPSPGHSLNVVCDFMTAREFLRSERNRMNALSTLRKADEELRKNLFPE